MIGLKYNSEKNEYTRTKGIEHLAERFVIDLLTEKESIKYLEHKGCNFIRRLKRASTERDVLVAFVVALNSLKKQYKKEDKFNYLQFKTAKISKINITDGGLELEINVFDHIGNYHTIKTPLIALD